jgi:hypothetical protein
MNSQQDVKLEKVKWQFWQQCNGYDYGEDNLVCFFDTNTRFEEGGESILPNGGRYMTFGTFTLHRKFKMSNGKDGVNKHNSLKSIDLKQDTTGKSTDEFKQLGIFEVYNKYKNGL